MSVFLGKPKWNVLGSAIILKLLSPIIIITGFKN